MNTTGMRRPGQAPIAAKHRGSQGPRHRLAVARYSATSEDGKATNTPSNNSSNGMTSTLDEDPVRHTLVRPQVQDDTPAATSMRLHSLNQGLLVRLREEAAERAALQLQLVQAQSAAFQASLTAEGSAAQLEQERNERVVLEARNEAQGTNLAMMEAKLGRLWSDVQALETRNMAAVAAQNTLIAERDKLARQMDSMKQEVADVSARGVEAQAASRKALADLEAALETSRRTEQLAREQQASVMNQLSVAQAELADMQQQALAAMQEAATLRDQLAAVQAAQAIAVLPPPPEVNSAELQEAMQANAQLSADFHQAEASIQNLSSELQAAQDTMRALTQQLSDVRAELAEARTAPRPSPAEAAERQQLTRQLRVLEMQLETSERERKLEVAMVANNAMLARDQGVATQAALEQLLAEVKSLKEANLALQQHQTREENASAGLALQQQTRVSDLETQLASTQAQLGTELKQARQQLVLEKTASSNLNKEVQMLQHRLTISERLLAQRATAGHLLSGTRSVHGSASLPPDVHLTVNRYWAPPELHFALLKALAMREARLQACVDFLGMRVSTEYEQVVVTAVWQSRSAFEAWSSDRAAGASMVALPEGVMQYPPKDKGEGVPEPYVPFRQYNY